METPDMQALEEVARDLSVLQPRSVAHMPKRGKEKQPSRYLPVHALCELKELLEIVDDPIAPMAAKASAKLWLDSVMENSPDIRRKAYAEILDRVEGKATQRAILDTQVTGIVSSEPAKRDVQAWQERHKIIPSAVVGSAGQIAHDDPAMVGLDEERSLESEENHSQPEEDSQDRKVKDDGNHRPSDSQTS